MKMRMKPYSTHDLWVLALKGQLLFLNESEW